MVHNQEKIVLCKDRNEIYERALEFAKQERQQVIEEEKSRKDGYWSVLLQNGCKTIFCTKQYLDQQQ